MKSYCWYNKVTLLFSWNKFTIFTRNNITAMVFLVSFLLSAHTCVAEAVILDLALMLCLQRCKCRTSRIANPHACAVRRAVAFWANMCRVLISSGSHGVCRRFVCTSRLSFRSCHRLLLLLACEWKTLRTSKAISSSSLWYKLIFVVSVLCFDSLSFFWLTYHSSRLVIFLVSLLSSLFDCL